MKTILLAPLMLGATLALGACANNGESTADTASATPATDAATAAPAAPAATTDATAATTADAATGAADPMAGMSAQEHAAMDAATNAHGEAHGDGHAAADAAKGAAGMSTSTQAGWYTAGTFRACGSAQAMKVDNTAEIDAQIKKGGMNAGDPVYVQVEGMPMGKNYMLTRVVQVGSKTPVRDCPMTGTTTQAGG
jgi:hypothetical protein